MATTPYTETSSDTLSGSINGVNTDYTVTNTPDTYSVLGFINGTFISTTVSGNVVTFASAPVTGDTVSVHYTVSTSVASSSGAVTALEIIQSALRRINRLGVGQTISTADLSFSLGELNDLIDHWRALKRFVLYYSHSEYTWTTSKQSYTIGQDSADFTADRPIKIARANLIHSGDDPDSYTPLAVYDMTEYASLSTPVLSDEESVCIYYQPTVPNGTIWPWPYPANTAEALANKLQLFTWSYLNEFATSDTSVDLAPGYKDALKWTLAERLADAFGVTLTDTQKKLARQSRAAIASNNLKSYKITSDYGIPNAEDYG